MRVINQGVDGMKAKPVPDAGADAAAARVELAKQYELLASSVSGLELGDEGLRESAARYGRVTSRAADLLRRGARAIRNNDADALGVHEEQYADLVRQEGELVAHIGGLCRPK